MGTVPTNPKLRLQWYEAHIAQFAANAVAIGSSTTATTDLQTKITASRAKYDAKVVAEGAAKTATSEWHSANGAMGLAGSAIIDQIRSKAKMSGDGIYDLAGIPAPATPTPVGPPGQPTDLVSELTQTGALDMKWKCANPVGASGTTYNVFRYTGGGTPSPSDFDYVGGTGVREFTDESVPAGVPMIIYKIQAVRSTTVGPWATFNVFMGVSSSGGAIVQSVVNTSPKIAA